MFDGNAGSTAGADANVARLCALYDGLLERADATVSAEAETELKALAKIFDLDAERPAAELWPYVRAVLVRQAPANAAAATTASDPLTVLLVEDDAEAAVALTEALDAAGPLEDPRPVNHVLPAWDLLTGAYAAFANGGRRVFKPEQRRFFHMIGQLSGKDHR